MECYVCGAPLPEGANFCPSCGRNLSAAPAGPADAVNLPEAAESPAVPVLPAGEEAAPVSPAPEPVTGELAEKTPADESGEAPEEAPEENPAAPIPEVPPVSAAAQPRQKPWLIPILVMTSMMLVGLICFWLIPLNSADKPAETTPQVQEGSTLPTVPPGKDLPDPNDIPTAPRPSEGQEAADGSLFRLTAQGLEFVGGSFDSTVLVIPDQIDGQAVTAIAEYGFAGLEGVTTIILPDSLESIGDHAFEGCSNLRGVYVPERVHTIGDGAYNQCISLEAAYIPGSVTRIGVDAFGSCASLRFLFYDGGYEDWVELYNEYITPFTYVTCHDGDYYHGAYTP